MRAVVRKCLIQALRMCRCVHVTAVHTGLLLGEQVLWAPQPEQGFLLAPECIISECRWSLLQTISDPESLSPNSHYSVQSILLFIIIISKKWCLCIFQHDCLFFTHPFFLTAGSQALKYSHSDTTHTYPYTHMRAHTQRSPKSWNTHTYMLI